jgi:prevent-host-death family protein
MQPWPLQHAKARFSELVKLAAKKPQTVSVRGVEEVVVISKKHYQALTSTQPDLIRLFRDSPFYGADLTFPRDTSLARPVDL